MTKKDYIKFANALKFMKPSQLNDEMYKQWKNDVTGIVNVLEADNDKFDWSRFALACGFEVGDSL